MNLKRVFPFIAILAVVLMGSCKKDEVSGVRPTVTSVDPVNNAINVVINGKISAGFSVAMDPSTITASTFTLRQGTTAVAGAVGSTGTTATFTPAANLTVGTVYTATITTGAKDLVGTSLSKDFTWSFTTAASLDTTLPTVVLTDPLNNATGVALNRLIVANFSLAMDPSTITASTFTIKQESAIVLGAVTYTGTAATFTPASNLTANKIYTGTISTAVRSTTGKAMGSAYTFTFTTSDGLDTTLPVVSSTDPLNNATGVALAKAITFTFSEAMNPSTINASTFTLLQGTTAVSGAITYSGNVMTFTPSFALTAGKVYTATISTGAKDLAGNALAANAVRTFTTVSGALDTTAPVVSSTDPLNLATSIALNKVVMITFSEAMDPLTINASTFTIKQGTTAVAGTVALSGTSATFTTSALMTSGLVYTATISTGAKDIAGNALAASTVWTFTTVAPPDTTAPVVNAIDPLNTATGVALNKVISVTFSEAMNASTINATTFTLKQGTTVIPGTVAYSGTTATFTPTTALAAGAYTATITTGAKDLAGNALAANVVSSFTTVGAADTIPPVANATDPLSSVIGVSTSKVVSITFSEAMDPLTINATTFTLTQGTTPVAGTVTYTGNTATFTPSNLLGTGLSYTATITTGAKDLAGNAIASNIVWNFTTSTVATLAPVNLGAAGDYVILAKTTVTTTGTTAVTGDLGLSPAATSFYTGFALTNATGFATSSLVTGKLFAADMAAPTGTNLTTAVNNMLTAYTDAAGRPTPDFSELATGNIGGRTLTPGLYKWTTDVTAPANVVISGGANDVWIFQISGNLIVSGAVNFTLTGGAQAKNIFWQVAGQATMGTTSHFEGIILSQTGITFQTGASLTGRALAQTAVILDSNAITKPQ